MNQHIAYVALELKRPRTEQEKKRASEIRKLSDRIPSDFRNELLGADNNTLICSHLGDLFGGSMESYVIIDGGLKTRGYIIRRQTTETLATNIKNAQHLEVLQQTYDNLDGVVVHAQKSDRSVVYYKQNLSPGNERYFLTYEDHPDLIRLHTPDSARERLHSINVLSERLADLSDGKRYEVVAWDEKTQTFYALRPMKDSTKVPKPGAWVYGFLGADDGTLREFMGKPEHNKTRDDLQRMLLKQSDLTQFAIKQIQRDTNNERTRIDATYDINSESGVYRFIIDIVEKTYGYYAVIPSRKQRQIEVDHRIT